MTATKNTFDLTNEPLPLIFDLESGPLDDETLLSFSPFAEPQPPGEFDPTSVAVGNLKDPAKIEAKIAEARDKHERSVNGHAALVETARIQHLDGIRDKAALSPVTGRVLAIGLLRPQNGGLEPKATIIHGDDNEAGIISAFWKKASEQKSSGGALIGFNILNFDLPFLVRRSWILGIDPPEWARNRSQWSSPLCIDLRQIWTFGQMNGQCESSLDAVARALGAGTKPEGITGADFARLWREDRPTAEGYLLNDLLITYRVARRIGVV